MTVASPDPLLALLAIQSGFDLVGSFNGVWLERRSSHAPLRVWLTVDGEGRHLVAMSLVAVDAALERERIGARAAVGAPSGASAVRVGGGRAETLGLLQRAFQLARALPDDTLRAFGARTAAMPRNTEAERLAVQRVGQDLFRERLLDHWQGACAVSRLAVPELLRASHIKPWADCETDVERLDVFNGLLLSPALDALFDGGWMTVLDDGEVRVAGMLDCGARELLGVASSLRVRSLEAAHRRYLAWHREHVFRGG